MADSPGFQFGLKHAVGAAIFSAGMLLAVPLINTDEGYSLKSYPDSAHIWTACGGIAKVLPNHTYTDAECKQMDAAADSDFGRYVAAHITVPVTPPIFASHVAFALNVGKHGYKISRTLRLTNKKQFADGCRAMLDFHRTGGRDCLIHANGCYGLINRRNRDINFCLKGVN